MERESPLSPTLKEEDSPHSSLPPSLAPFSLGAAGGDGGVCVGGAEGHDGGDKGGAAARRGSDYLISVAVGQGAVD